MMNFVYQIMLFVDSVVSSWNYRMIICYNWVDLDSVCAWEYKIWKRWCFLKWEKWLITSETAPSVSNHTSADYWLQPFVFCIIVIRLYHNLICIKWIWFSTKILKVKIKGKMEKKTGCAKKRRKQKTNLTISSDIFL